VSRKHALVLRRAAMHPDVPPLFIGVLHPCIPEVLVLDVEGSVLASYPWRRPSAAQRGAGAQRLDRPLDAELGVPERRRQRARRQQLVVQNILAVLFTFAAMLDATVEQALVQFGSKLWSSFCRLGGARPRGCGVLGRGRTRAIAIISHSGSKRGPQEDGALRAAVHGVSGPERTYVGPAASPELASKMPRREADLAAWWPGIVGEIYGQP